MNDPEVAVYFALVNPKNTVQYGGVTVGPLIKEAMINCFSILNIPKQSDGIKLDARYWIDKKTYQVPSYIGIDKNNIKMSSYYNIEFIGDGDSVIEQLPSAGSDIVENGTVLLYLE